MPAFCGQDYCSLDANGRLKLSPRVIEDFMRHSDGAVVMHCLPEGAVALYPEETYRQMRQADTDAIANLGNSLLLRRTMRRFGALSEACTITRQGRVTVPLPFRKHAGLEPGTDLRVVGVEVGVEIWSAERWEKELEVLNSHWNARGEHEMNGDLKEADTPGSQYSRHIP